MKHVPVITAADLQVRFGRKRALDGLDLEIMPGGVTVLLGPNGSGKSTFLRTCLGMLRPSHGATRVLGLDPLRQPDELRQRLGYVPDRPDAPPWMRVSDLCRFLRAHYRSWDQRLCDELIERFEVPRRTRIGSMSKGQAMKAMLVTATASMPELLILDEPFGGLDPVVREDVCKAILTTFASEGRTIVCATHELELAARIADRVAVIRGGRLQTEGTLPEVLQTDEPASTPQGLRALLRATQLSDAKDGGLLRPVETEEAKTC